MNIYAQTKNQKTNRSDVVANNVITNAQLSDLLTKWTEATKNVSIKGLRVDINEASYIGPFAIPYMEGDKVNFTLFPSGLHIQCSPQRKVFIPWNQNVIYDAKTNKILDISQLSQQERKAIYDNLSQSLNYLNSLKTNENLVSQNQRTQRIPDMLTYQDIQLYAPEMVNDKNAPVHVMKLSEFMNFVNKGRGLTEKIHLSGDNLPDIICFKDTVTNKAGVSMRGYFILVNDSNQNVPANDYGSGNNEVMTRYSRDYIQYQINNGKNKTFSDALGPYIQQSPIQQMKNIFDEVNALGNTLEKFNIFKRR